MTQWGTPLAPDIERPPRAIQLGPGGRLFGALDTPVNDGNIRASAVLFAPFGHEAVWCHRALRVLSARLAASGLAVLRFDWSGTGDSYGESAAIALETWLEDARAAIDWIEARYPRPIGIGVRFGASLALLSGASDERPLALWQPVADGLAFLRRQRALQQAHAAEWGWSYDPEGPYEVLGFGLAPGATEAIASWTPDLLGATSKTSSTLHLINEDGDDQRALTEAFQPRVQRTIVEEERRWEAEPNQTFLAGASLDHLSEWTLAQAAEPQ